ncbi:hypothetical protein Q3O43_28020 (plasmid) [Rhodococcus aetherivorans]|nr:MULTISPECIES: hypothetical protein [Rhodococcus]WKX01820.1 hypothetical protein Q3O43_28020 [Rhodococcus aetherivorans]
MSRRDLSGPTGSSTTEPGGVLSAEDVPCSPCVAQLHSPAEELAALRAAIEHEPDPLVTLTHLLHLCRDEHPVLWEQAGNPAIQATVTQMLEPLHVLVRSRPATAALDPATRRGLADALRPVEAVAPVMVARALAQFLDDHYGQFFADSFRRRSPYQPGVGDPIPLGGPDIRTVMDMQPTAPPWRLANRLDETRRVRLAGGWATQFRVVFDYSLVETATDLITADTIVATCHPNRGLTEFTSPTISATPRFRCSRRISTHSVRASTDSSATRSGPARPSSCCPNCASPKRWRTTCRTGSNETTDPKSWWPAATITPTDHRPAAATPPWLGSAVTTAR